MHPELRVARVHHSFYGDPAEWKARVPQTGFYVRHHGVAWVIRRFLNLEKRGYRARPW